MARTTLTPRKMVSLRLTQEVINKIDTISTELGISKSDVVCLSINGQLEGKKKMKIMFNEACGKTQGRMTVIEADSFEQAIKEFGADEVIRPYQQFKNCYFKNVYEVYEVGNPAHVQYVVHKA